MQIQLTGTCIALLYVDSVRVKVAELQHMRAVVGESQIRKRGFGFSTCGEKYHLIAALRFLLVLLIETSLTTFACTFVQCKSCTSFDLIQGKFKWDMRHWVIHMPLYMIINVSEFRYL